MCAFRSVSSPYYSVCAQRRYNTEVSQMKINAKAKALSVMCFMLAAASITAMFSSCGKKENTDDANGDGTDNPPISDIVTPPDENKDADGDNIPVINDGKKDDTDTPSAEHTDGYYSLLTGEKCDKELSTKRPVGIMLNNIRAALPQQGISNCDILYEVRAEGGITRYLALFLDYASLPETGSVRSSRDYYIDLAEAHDAIYAHCGGSPDAYSALQSRGINNLDGTNDKNLLSGTYYRSAARRKTMAVEHTMMTDGERLAKAIEAKGYRTDVESGFKGPFSFSDTAVSYENSIDCNYVYVHFSNYVQAYFDYDSEAGLYKKGQYFNTSSSLGKKNSPQIDGNTKEQLAFKNVIVLMASQYEIKGDAKGRIAVDFVGEGKGHYITDGKMVDIVWKKADRETPYKLYLADGTTELKLNTGKSYIAIAPDDAEIVCSLDE